MREFSIPFAGFYESVHDQIFDDELNQMCENQDNGGINHNLSCYLSGNVNWKQAQVDYAQDYVENFARELNIKGLKFTELDSPGEYNFTTDRIFAKCSDAEFYRMFKLVKGETLNKVSRANLTSRSGFSSFYDPDYTLWGHWKTWDNNQLSQVVEAYVSPNGAHWFRFDEYELMENSRGNSVISGIIERNCKPEALQRVYKISDYLTLRAAR